MLGFSSEHALVITVLSISFCVMVCSLLIVTEQIAADAYSVRLLLKNGHMPDLSLFANQKYHLFLSHTWSSGQDQVAVIKRQLTLLLPESRIFLDVDDLVRAEGSELMLPRPANLHRSNASAPLCFGFDPPLVVTGGYRSTRAVRAGDASHLDLPFVWVFFQSQLVSAAVQPRSPSCTVWP